MTTSSLARFAWLSIAAALTTMGLKATAYLLTGSVGLLSDALESGVNLAAGLMALWMLTIAARPADTDHAFGHGKAEYFSSGVEGALILVAAVSIAITAVDRLITPKPLEQVGVGLAVSVAASAVNLVVALILFRAARHYYSISLQADARHLLTDVWTSAGVLAGVSLVAVTGWHWLDPVVALAVAVHIVRSGVDIVRESISGLMDKALPVEEQNIVRAVLEQVKPSGVTYHALRTRQAGARKFVSVHVLVPGVWTVQRGHKLLEQIESDISSALPNVDVFTHLESLNDPASWEDRSPDRKGKASSK